MFMMKRMMDMMLLPTHLKFWMWIPMVAMVLFLFLQVNFEGSLIGFLSYISPIVLGLFISGTLYLQRQRKFYQPMVSTAHLMIVILPVLGLMGSFGYAYYNSLPINLIEGHQFWIYCLCLFSFFIGYFIYGYNFYLANKRIKEFN